MATRRIFFDTEFTGLTVGHQLISIGCIDESGTQTFYAELSDTWLPADLGEFAAQAVVPLLEGGNALMTMDALQERLSLWLVSFEEPVRLATDALCWDWPWIQEIFPSRTSWPVNLEPQPLLLTMNYLRDFDAFAVAVEKPLPVACAAIMPWMTPKPTESVGWQQAVTLTGRRVMVGKLPVVATNGNT